MDKSTIGDDMSVQYEFDWQDGLTRTSDELGDFEEAGLDVTVEDIVDIARDDPDCEVRVIGIE